MKPKFLGYRKTYNAQDQRSFIQCAYRGVYIDSSTYSNGLKSLSDWKIKFVLYAALYTFHTVF